MRTRRKFLALLVALASLVVVGSAGAEPLDRVPAARVCMVNNTRFDKDQIPVPVGGETYFGCCEMCKGRLSADASVRRAMDPVSGKPVDKAKAVIGAKPDGKVLYFESEKTFSEYQKRKPSESRGG
jgi:YHS domain-containing protein